MIKAIIGLGNPGNQYHYTRHNIGFRVLDALVERFGSLWHIKDRAEVAEITVHGLKIMLIKPQTFMNSSGAVISMLQKKGITVDEMVVVHDELELPFGRVKFKTGGSAKGHNGLRSIIAHCGEGFMRIRCGIGRPDQSGKVSDYVLTNFSEPVDQVNCMIEAAVEYIVKTIAS